MTVTTPRQPAIGFIFVTMVFSVLGFGLLIPVLPELIKQFQGGAIEGATDAYGPLMSCFALLQFIGSPILGSLSDRFGRRRVILVALVGSSIDYIVMANAPSLSWIFVGRCISGLTAGVFATANAYVADVTVPEKRAQSFGLLGAAFGIGFVIGPVLGGFLGQINLRLPFWFAAGCAACNFLWGFFVLPESLKPEHRREFSWKRSNPFGALKALQRFPSVRGLADIYFLLMLAQTVVFSVWVLYMGFRYDWSPRDNGLSLGMAGVIMGGVQAGLVRKIVPKFGEGRTVLVGLTISIVANVCYGLATHGWMIYATIVFAAFGGISGPALQSYVSRQIPPNEQGGVQGIFSGLSSLASVPGPILGNRLFGWAASHGRAFSLLGLPFFVAASLVLAAMIGAARIFRKSPAAEAPA